MSGSRSGNCLLVQQANSGLGFSRHGEQVDADGTRGIEINPMDRFVGVRVGPSPDLTRIWLARRNGFVEIPFAVSEMRTGTNGNRYRRAVAVKDAVLGRTLAGLTPVQKMDPLGACNADGQAA